MKTSLYLIMAAVMIFVFNACEEKKDDPAPAPPSKATKLVNVKVVDRYRINVNGTLVARDSLLPGATVRLYKTQSDMTNNISIGSASTNNKGETSINAGGDADGQFYVKAFHPKNSETEFQIVTFTPNAVTVFAEIRLPL